MSRFNIITDGSYLKERGIGGWAAIIEKNGEGNEKKDRVVETISGGGATKDNYEMELRAVLNALQEINKDGKPHEIFIRCDVDGIVNTINAIANGLRTGGEFILPEAQKKLWGDMANAMRPHNTVRAEWVPSKNGGNQSNAVHREAYYAALRALSPLPFAVITVKGAHCGHQNGQWATAIKIDGEEPVLINGQIRTSDNYELELKAALEGIEHLNRTGKPYNILVISDHRGICLGIGMMSGQIANGKNIDVPRDYAHREAWIKIADALQKRPHALHITKTPSAQLQMVNKAAKSNGRGWTVHRPSKPSDVKDPSTWLNR